MGVEIIKVSEFTIEPVIKKAVTPFIEKWHYSHYAGGIQHRQCFALYSPDGPFGLPRMIGAMIYGIPAMYGVAERYYEDNPSIVIELNRLCCIDDTPKNTESYFIGKTLNWLKHNTKYRLVLSYADLAQGHEGIIYKASNFTNLGMTSPDRVLIVDGERYHSRMITKKSPKFEAIRQRVKRKDENITIEKLPTKHIYAYGLNKKIKKHLNRFKNEVL